MRLTLLERLRCPCCQGTLKVASRAPARPADPADGPAAAPALLAGQLACVSCGEQYPVEGGVPRLLAERLPGIAEKRREMAGWVALAKEQGWYAPDDALDLALPFVNRDLGWRDPLKLATEHSFALLLERCVRPGSRVLEVGAAKCWGALHLVPRGCEYVAVDILDDACIGLGRGAFYAELVGHFERVQADGEHLPFASGSFDLTYCVASLHHALSLARMVGEMARVTRPGGVVAALNEGTRPLGWSADAPGQRAERQHGINEHVHTLWRYGWAFVRAGLLPWRVEQADGYERLAQHPVAGRLLRLPRGQLWATLYVHDWVAYDGVSLYATRLGVPGRATHRGGGVLDRAGDRTRGEQRRPDRPSRRNDVQAAG